MTLRERIARERARFGPRDNGLLLGRPRCIMAVSDVYGEPEKIAVLYAGNSRYTYYDRKDFHGAV